MTRSLLALSVALCAVAAAPARADGNLAVASGEAGPFRVDVLVAPLPLRVGTAEWSVLVRDLASDEIVLDAEVELGLYPPTGSNAAVCGMPSSGGTPAPGGGPSNGVIQVRRGASANRLLHSARVELGAAGDWVGVVRVRHRDVAGELSFRVEVAPAAPPLAAHAWAFALPLLALSLFALHQWRARCEPRKPPG